MFDEGVHMVFFLHLKVITIDITAMQHLVA